MQSLALLPPIELDRDSLSVQRADDDEACALRISARCRVLPGVELETQRLQVTYWSAAERLLACEESSIDLDFMTDHAVCFTLEQRPRGVSFTDVARVELRTFARARSVIGAARFEAATIPSTHTLTRAVGLPVRTLGEHEVGIARRQDATDMNLDILGRLGLPSDAHIREARVITLVLDAEERLVAKDDNSIELLRAPPGQDAPAPIPFRTTVWCKLGLWELASWVELRIVLVHQHTTGPISVPMGR